jgi:hypothetical protein
MHSAPASFRAPIGNHAFTGNMRYASRHSYPYGFGGYGYPGYASLPFPFFGDGFDASDIYSTGYPVSDSPPPSLMQALQSLINPAALITPAANTAASLITPPGNHDGSSSDPLMIELQNGRYVRVNGPVITGDADPINFSERSAAANPLRISKAAPHEEPPQTVAAAPLPPVTLIFRDGHSEQVRDYTIAQGALYARGDYYIDGYWNKKIDLANLDVPATLQTNASHNVNFVLPTSPNEVITRP